MTINELLDQYQVSLAYFDNELWQRPGVYIKEISIIFINRELSENAKRRVIYHELGHLEHSMVDCYLHCPTMQLIRPYVKSLAVRYVSTR